MNTMQKICNILAILCFLIAAIMINEGLDKVNNYYRSELRPSLNRNVYVGGDAYNFIINSNYATGYYVLAMISVIAGFGFIIVGYLSQIVHLQKETASYEKNMTKRVSEEGFEKNNEIEFTNLPEL